MNHEVYNDVLNNMHNQEIKNFTIMVLKDAPEFLEKIPTSSTGKYHPPECNTEGGLVKHVLRCCFFAQMLMKDYGFKEDEIRWDMVMSALLLHDIGKKEFYPKNRYWEYVNHPFVACEMMEKHSHMLNDKVFESIRNCVMFHMGQWTPKSMQKPVLKYTFLEFLTHTADLLASKKEIVLNHGE